MGTSASLPLRSSPHLEWPDVPKSVAIELTSGLGFPIPGTYASEAADIARDERKRLASPPSFFFAQTKGLVLAAGYFVNTRLRVASHSAVAGKHRHRIQASLFGQLMAAFEYCLKDFVAQIIDGTDIYDSVIERSDWISIDKSRILAQRDVPGRIGAMLIHPLLGWQEPREVNARYRNFFEQEIFTSQAEIETINRLWIPRHTVAHNAGFVTHHDSYRLRAPLLKERTIQMSPEYLGDTRLFLGTVIRRMADPVGSAVMSRWLRQRSSGDFRQDAEAYSRLKLICTVMESRTTDLPGFVEADYMADRAALGL
jgi:hypothetical protein